MRTRRILAGLLVFGLVGAAGAASAGRKPPRTGFEERGGASWTTHEEELDFLKAVDRGSALMSYEVIGRTIEDRPLHLVRLGSPRPRPAAAIRRQPTLLFVCSQHGNEQAGREVCLQLLRNLAYSRNGGFVHQMRNSTVLFIPAANPDGLEANTRGNAQGTDVNRDHLNLATPEARAIAEVVRDFEPDVVLDLHEYGPSIPVLYDDDILYLWPRNLNVDQQIHGLSKTLAIDYIAKEAEEAGYSSDEYGLYAVGDQDVMQTAGDHDEGILRNAMGLRHAVGILVESAVSPDPTSPGEVIDEATLNLRRVASQMVVARATLKFMREQGNLVRFATQGAPDRKRLEGLKRSAPVYFGGADNDPPEPAEIVDPPPCGYRLTVQQLEQLGPALKLHGIRVLRAGGELLVRMAQAAEPVIPLLLDARGQRHAVEAKPLNRC